MAPKKPILDRLTDIANCRKFSDPTPDWLPINGWAEPIADMAQDARDEILYLQARREDLQTENTHMQWLLCAMGAAVTIYAIVQLIWR